MNELNLHIIRKMTIRSDCSGRATSLDTRKRCLEGRDLAHQDSEQHIFNASYNTQRVHWEERNNTSE